MHITKRWPFSAIVAQRQRKTQNAPLSPCVTADAAPRCCSAWACYRGTRAPADGPVSAAMRARFRRPRRTDPRRLEKEAISQLTDSLKSAWIITRSGGVLAVGGRSDAGRRDDRAVRAGLSGARETRRSRRVRVAGAVEEIETDEIAARFPVEIESARGVTSMALNAERDSFFITPCLAVTSSKNPSKCSCGSTVQDKKRSESFESLKKRVTTHTVVLNIDELMLNPSIVALSSSTLALGRFAPFAIGLISTCSFLSGSSSVTQQSR